MLGRLNHIAIAVPNLETAITFYRDILGGNVSEAVAQPEHGVKTVFVSLPNSKLELLEPLSPGSPITKFLERNPHGGIHHFCLEVEDIDQAMARLQGQGVRVLGEPKIGAHGKPVIFIHPKDGLGCLIEFEQR